MKLYFRNGALAVFMLLLIGALSSTTLTCTTGTTGKTCSDTSHTVACTAGQGWSVQENVAGTEANTGLNMYGLTYTVP